MEFSLSLKPQTPSSPYGCNNCSSLHSKLQSLFNTAKAMHEENQKMKQLLTNLKNTKLGFDENVKLKNMVTSLKKEVEIFKPRMIPSKELIQIKDEKTKKEGDSTASEVRTWIGAGGGVAVHLKYYKVVNDNMKKFKNELGCMCSLSHPNIARVYGYSAGKSVVSIVREHVSNISLLQAILNSKNKGKLSNSWKWEIMKQIVVAVNFLHSKKVIHRNLNLDAFHITKDKKGVKLTSFGMSKFCEGDSLISSTPGIKGTWKPPETVGWSPTWTPKSDVFSLGFIFWEIATQKRPVLPTSVSFDSHISDGRRPPTVGLHKCFKELIESAWHHNQDKRPTCLQILKYIYDNEKNMKN